MGQVGGQQNDYAAVVLRGGAFLNNNNDNNNNMKNSTWYFWFHARKFYNTATPRTPTSSFSLRGLVQDPRREVFIIKSCEGGLPQDPRT